MKLRNLAALLFRLLGALFVLTGLSSILSGILDAQNLGVTVDGICVTMLGLLPIYFSKKLAKLFCKGLDDDSF